MCSVKHEARKFVSVFYLIKFFYKFYTIRRSYYVSLARPEWVKWPSSVWKIFLLLLLPSISSKMEFRFNVNDVFKHPIVEVNQNLMPPQFSGDRRSLWYVPCCFVIHKDGVISSNTARELEWFIQMSFMRMNCRRNPLKNQELLCHG